MKAFAEEAGVNANNISAEIRDNLAKNERISQQWLEGTQLRVVMGVLMKHLIVSGNYLLQCDMSLKVPVVRGYRMDKYVVNRTPTGKILEIIIHEIVDPLALTDEVLEAVGIEREESPSAESKTYDMYTYIKVNGKKYDIFQEINGKVVPGSEGSYPEDRLPFLPLTWEREDSEQYGRSYIEQYIGDMISTEGLSKSLYEAAAASSKVVYLVNPNGTTRKKTLVDAPNCGVISGDERDVSVVQTGKMNDLQVTKAQLGDIIQRMNSAFISQSSIQRQAERVTAEEIRMMAEMLDQQLGGVYARFSKELQDPLARIVIKGLEKSKRIEPIPDGLLKVQIITGIDALGRGQELQALRGAVTDTIQLIGPEAIAGMHVNELVNRIFHGYGANPTGVVKTPEELQAEQEAAQQAQQQQQAMEMAQQVAPQVVANEQAQQQAQV